MRNETFWQKWVLCSGLISPEIKRNTVTMAIEQQLQENKNVTLKEGVTFCDSEKTALKQECYGVTATKGENTEETKDDSLTGKDNAADTLVERDEGKIVASKKAIYV